MIISISGTSGSGKSTVAKRLAKKLKYNHYSMGDLQREIAEEKNLTIAELGELEKNNPSIDKMIDNKQRQLGKKKDNFVIDGLLSPLFIPHAIKIFMDAELESRVNRIIMHGRKAESHATIADAIKTTKKREKTNQQRWIKFYNYDYKNKDNFDLIIDTTHLNKNQVFAKIYEFVKKQQ